MDHDNSKALLNIIGGKGAISNINYYYYNLVSFEDAIGLPGKNLNFEP